MLTIYLGTNLWIFEHFAKSYQSTSNWAKISILNGVPLLMLRCWVNINHWLAICSIRCLFTPDVGLFWIIRRFQEQFWWNKIQNILTGLCSLVPPHFVSLFENVCHPDLVDDYVRLFLYSCVCYGMSTKKNTKYHSHKKGKKGWISFLLKEYAHMEGVSARFGVDLESASDLSRGIGVSKTVEFCEKVQRTSARPHVDLLPGRNGTGTHLTHA